jgi:DNA-binding MarR family transcriptional regulator
MDGRLPLPALLSFALVAFTVEFDNESEHQLPHRTTHHGSTGGSLHAPWLVSLVMWFNCMRFVDEKGVTVRQLEQLARTKTNLNGMERWGYIVVAPDPNDSRPKPPRSSWLIHPTRAGRQAQEIWRPLVAIIEGCWEQRFGKRDVAQLRRSLLGVVHRFELDLPDCLPILGYGLFSRERANLGVPRKAASSDGDLPLPCLFSRVLLAFAIEFEAESRVSLAVCANVLRLVDEDGVPLRDLPRLSGVSKEGIAMALTFLKNRAFATVQPESSGSRVKMVVLTAKGREAQEHYFELLPEIEERWRAQFGEQAIRALRNSLEQLALDGSAHRSPLFGGLEPYPEGWRASVPRPETLPHYPLVLHRGGFPDGS